MFQEDPGAEAVAPDRGGDSQQHGRGPQPTVPAQVQPVPASDAQRPDGLLGRPVVIVSLASVR